MSEPATTCTFVKEDGERCKVKSGLQDGLCVWHHPDRARATAMRRRGGYKTALRGVRTVEPEDLPGPLETLEDAVRWAAWTARATALGELDSKTAQQVTNAIRELRSSLDRLEVESRQKAIESGLRQARRAQA